MVKSVGLLYIQSATGFSGNCFNKDCFFLHVQPAPKPQDCPWYNQGFCKDGESSADRDGMHWGMRVTQMGIRRRQGVILPMRACAIDKRRWKAFLNLSEACTSVENSPETLGNAAWHRAQGLPREGWGIHSLPYPSQWVDVGPWLRSLAG